LLVAVQGRIADARLANPSTAPTVTFIQLAPDEIGVDAIQGGVGKPSLSIAVAKIGCVGPEVWLGALAYGAAAVVLQTPEDHPRQLQAVLVEQHAWATTILAGVGLSPRRIQLRAAGFSEEAPVDSADVPGRPADFSPFQSKRMLIRRSVAHLAGKADITNAAVALPAGAPFGGIAVDGSACTLCMACAGECPTRALNAAGDSPDLRIVESDCIQCGRCRTICPEQAIQLLPRRLCAQAPFACISCGQGFAPTGLVARMVQRLDGHWMYSGEKEIRRLKMCPDCRVRDLFLDNQPERRP